MVPSSQSDKQRVVRSPNRTYSARKEVTMARLTSLVAVAALVLSAAFAAGLTCGG